MGISRREAIGQALFAAIADDARPAGMRVYRDRRRPLDGPGGASTWSVVILFFGEEAVSRESQSADGAHLLRTLTFHVACYATGEVPEAALDPVVSWAETRLTTYNAALRAAGARDVREMAATWDSAELAEHLGRAVLTFQVDFNTAEADPEVA
ncbi:MAG: hypothetical protein JWM27_87 [Gemmatimonadetes bacterium]|nr:hypothetical protein [Gemmatimonadota bacterium]